MILLQLQKKMRTWIRNPGLNNQYFSLDEKERFCKTIYMPTNGADHKPNLLGDLLYRKETHKTMGNSGVQEERTCVWPGGPLNGCRPAAWRPPGWPAWRPGSGPGARGATAAAAAGVAAAAAARRGENPPVRARAASQR